MGEPGTLARLAEVSLLDAHARGMPPGTPPLRLDRIGRQGWSLPAEDLCLPVLTLSEPAMAHNLAILDTYAAEQGVFICAHGKTTMAPQLLERVLAGSRTVGLCAATTQQARVMAECGAANVFIANQVSGKANLRMLAELVGQFTGTRFLSLVDSIAGIEQLLAIAGPHLGSGAGLDILIEVGVPGARCGVRTIAEARQLMDYISARHAEGAPVRLCGVSTYEGAVPAGPDWEARCDALFALTREIYRTAFSVPQSSMQPILSAGGSATFDLAVAAFCGQDFAVAPDIWLRPGVAPTYDHVIYQDRLRDMDGRRGFVLGGEVKSAVMTFRPALALWAVVQSIPDTDVAIIAAGIRDFPADAGYPTLLAQYRDGQKLADFSPGSHSLAKANDQHGYLPIDSGLSLHVGDVLKFGISHPCTAFDKWAVIYTVDDEDKVVGAIRTYF